ncbi:MAG: ATP-binding protein [Vulcanimicrobiaceae bacterium]
MMPRFARRLLVLATIEISATLAISILIVAFFAFGSYVRSLSATLDSTLAELTAVVSAMPSPQNAHAAARMAASTFLPAGIEAVFIDSDHRIVVYRPQRRDSQVIVDVRPRGDLSGDPQATGPLARAIVGLATAFGMQPRRAKIGALQIIVKENDRLLVANVRSFLLPVVLVLMLALLLGYLLARVLTRQVLRPLLDVTAALQRFAAGDLTPQTIPVDSHHELGSLAIAYNGAIDQMERAFSERERANASMRQFIADAGHQLRTPLTVVRGFISILRKGATDREHILEMMGQQACIMGSLIDKLMLLEHWEDEPSTSAEPIDIGRLVTDLLTPIAETHPQRTIRIEADSGLLAAIDPSEFGHAITNLVDNALKYTNGAIDVRVHDQGAYLAVEISDEGPGIAADDAAHVFDRFHRGERRDVDGSGLGLAIAKRAIERAQGTLTLESDVQAGSKFVIRLPRIRRETPTPAHA